MYGDTACFRLMLDGRSHFRNHSFEGRPFSPYYKLHAVIIKLVPLPGPAKFRCYFCCKEQGNRRAKIQLVIQAFDKYKISPKFTSQLSTPIRHFRSIFRSPNSNDAPLHNLASRYFP